MYVLGGKPFIGNVGFINSGSPFHNLQEMTLVKLFNALVVKAPQLAGRLQVEPVCGTRRKRA